jgi:hypothetical protein
MDESPIYVVATRDGVTLIASLGAFRDREVAGLLAQVEEGETGEACEVVELELHAVVPPAGLQLSFPFDDVRARGTSWWSGLVCPHSWAADPDGDVFGIMVSEEPGVRCVQCEG